MIPTKTFKGRLTETTEKNGKTNLKKSKQAWGRIRANLYKQAKDDQKAQRAESRKKLLQEGELPEEKACKYPVLLS